MIFKINYFISILIYVVVTLYLFKRSMSSNKDSIINLVDTSSRSSYDSLFANQDTIFDNTSVIPRNATIKHGYLSIFNTTIYVGKTSSAIQSTILKYFPKFSYKQMTNNLKYQIWLNSTNQLSYLTLIGDYIADVPIFLPHQFVLVLDGATLSATANFTSVNNTLDIHITKAALIVSNAAYYNAVVSPGGPSRAVLNCSAIPSDYPIQTPIVGPAGILMIGSGAFLVDGITVDSCGLNSGNIAIYGTGRAEISNCKIINSRTRGIWVIITSYTVIHDSEVYGSMKYGIDLDADSGPVTIIFNCYVHDNFYQGVFIEQGSYDSLVSDNLLVRNRNGISLFNNNFSQYCSNHVILSNNITQSLLVAINIGSISSSPAEFYPTINSYIIGNYDYNNSLQQKNTLIYGINSNGPAYGIVMVGNNDSQGASQQLLNKLIGNIMIPDPLKRMTSSPEPNNIANTTSSSVDTHVNATIINGILVEYSLKNTMALNNTFVGNKTSFVNMFIEKWMTSKFSFDSLINIPWIWQSSNSTNFVSYLTLKGIYECDEPLKLPPAFMLVLKDARLIMLHSFPRSSLGLIIASNSHFSGVVNPGSVDSSLIECPNATSWSSPSAIYVFNSSYFTVDGVSIYGCGAKNASIVLKGTSNHLVGNSTTVLNSKILYSRGNKILIQNMIRCIISKNVISYSSAAGVVITDKSYGSVLDGNLLVANHVSGIYALDGSTYTIIKGNMIKETIGDAISIINYLDHQSSVNNIILKNEITNNIGSSILLAVDVSSVIISTTIVGNYFVNNSHGLTIRDPSKWSDKGIQKTYYLSNLNCDGISESFLQQTNGNSASGSSGNFFLDPLDRGSYCLTNDTVSNYSSSPIKTSLPVTSRVDSSASHPFKIIFFIFGITLLVFGCVMGRLLQKIKNIFSYGRLAQTEESDTLELVRIQPPPPDD